jgi:hypothetical protein
MLFFLPRSGHGIQTAKILACHDQLDHRHDLLEERYWQCDRS